MDELIPDFMDEVKNKVSGVFGIVDATYMIDGINYIDAQVGDKMYYKSPRSNWEVTKKFEE